MKKILSFTLVFVLLLCLIGNTFAEGTGVISLSSAEGKPGDTVNVSINVDSNPGIVFMELGVDYDSSILEWIGITAGDFALDASDPGQLLTWDPDASTENYMDTGVFAVLTFKIKETASAGKTEVSVSYDPDSVYDANEDNVAFSVTPGNVTIQAAQHDHVWDEGIVTKEASCTEAGVKTYTCSVCGETKTEEIAALGHQPGAAVQEYVTPATCETAGNYDEVVYCSVCQKELSRVIKTVPATGHDWGAVTYTWANDNSTVTATRMCANDAKHVETETVNTTYATTAPTCEAAGVGTYSATFTNTAFEAQSKSLEIPATGHAWGGVTYTWADDNSSVTATRTCGNDSNHVETETVNTTYTATAPTCEAAGVGTYSATFTNTAFEAQSKSLEIPATGHDWGAWVETTPATEEAEGVETRTCQRDSSHTETRPIPKLNHVHKLVKTEAVAASCETAGNSAYYTCSACGKYFSDEAGTAEIEENSWVIPAMGHKPGAAVQENVTPATCTEEGSYDEVVRCSVCNTELSRETKTVAALGHTWDEGKVTTEPGCTEAGVKTYTCSVCGENKTEEIAALGHKPGEAVRENEKAASCTEEGSYDEVVRCSVCNAELSRETKTIAALGHDWGEWSVTAAPTCTTEGVQTRTCTRDGSHTETQPVAALGHDWGEWAVTTDPTCTEAGEETRTCTRDGTHTETQSVAALGHDWNDWLITTDPGCTENGVQTRTCKRDGTHTETQPVAALGHTWDEGKVTKEASCTEKGEIVYTCSVCKESKTEELAARGHQPDAGTVTKTATCTEPGIKTYTCTVCGEVLRTETLPALGHAWDAGKVTKDPTTTEVGKRLYTCQHDNAHVRMEDIPKLAPVPAANSTSPKTGDQDLARLALLLTLGGCGVVMAATLVRKKVRSK